MPGTLCKHTLPRYCCNPAQSLARHMLSLPEASAAVSESQPLVWLKGSDAEAPPSLSYWPCQEAPAQHQACYLARLPFKTQLDVLPHVNLLILPRPSNNTHASWSSLTAQTCRKTSLDLP